MKRNLLLQFLFLPVFLLLFLACNKKKPISTEQPTETNHKIGDSLSKPGSNINTYPSVKIGTQVWMTANLDVVVFRNGDTISEASSKAEWMTAIKNKLPAWCYNSNIEEERVANGKIYNYYAVSDKRGIEPKGWKVPSNRDWSKLVEYINQAPSQLPDFWRSKNFWCHLPDSINESGFNDINGGYRYETGELYSFNKNSFYWTSDYRFTTNAIDKEMWFKYGGILRVKDYTGFGFYIRCVK